MIFEEGRLNHSRKQQCHADCPNLPRRCKIRIIQLIQSSGTAGVRGGCACQVHLHDVDEVLQTPENLVDHPACARGGIGECTLSAACYRVIRALVVTG